MTSRLPILLALLALAIPSSPAFAGSGGPDAFGYVWRDTAGGGPAYNWIEISGTGTNLNLGDTSISTAQNLGFSFWYYGTAYTQVKVCSNGWITPVASETNTTTLNAAIPSATTPNPVIAGFWDDLDPSTTTGNGAVYFQSFGTHAVVEFDDVHVYGTTRKKKFQFVLYPDGRIVVQYHATWSNQSNGSATVGIENTTGTTGLQCLYNGTASGGFALAGSYAVEFRLPSNLACATATAIACDSSLTGQSTGAANDATTYGCSAGARDGNEKVYSLTLASTQNLDVAISGFGGRDLDVFLLSACQERYSCLAGGADTLSVDSLAPGTYYIVVDGKTAGDNGAFEIEVGCNPPSTLSCTPTCQTTVLQEGFNGGALPAGWTTQVITGNAWAHTVVDTCGGSGAVRYPYNGGAAGNSWLFTPGMALTAGTSYALAFDWKVYSATYPERMDVWIGNAASAAAMTTELWDESPLTSTTCNAEAIVFTVPSTGTWYVGFHDYSIANQWYVYVDDVSVCSIVAPTYSCASSQLLSCPASVNGTTVGGTTEFSAYSCSIDSFSGHERIYRLELTELTRVQATLSGIDKRNLSLFLLDSCDPCGCTASGLSIDELLPAGTWYLVVDGFDPVDDGPFTLDVTCSDPCAGIPPITCNLPVSGDTTDDANDLQASCGTSAGRDEMWELTFNGPIGSSLVVSLPNPGWDHVLYALTSCTDPASCVDWADSGNLDLVTTSDPQTYYIVVDGWNAAAYGTYSNLLVTCPIPNTLSCAGATALACNTAPAGTTAGAPDNASEYAGVAGTWDGGEKVYTFTLAAPTNIDIVLSGFGGRQMGMILLDPGLCNVNDVLASGTAISIDAAAAGTYNLVVDGRTAGDDGAFVVDFRCNPPGSVSCSASLEGFESVTSPALPAGWTTVATSGNPWDTQNDSLYSCGGTKSLRYLYHATAAADSWAFSPGFSLNAGTNYTLNFDWKVRSATYPETFAVSLCSAAAASCSSATPVFSRTGTTSTTCSTEAIPFTVPSTGTWYVGFRALSPANMWSIHIDDFGISGLGSADCSSAVALACAAPQNGTTAGGSSQFGAYSCSTDSWLGHEKIYTITVTEATRLLLSLSGFGGRNVSMFLLSACNPCNCLASGTSIDRVVSPGTYTLVVDGWTAADDGAFTVSLACEDPCLSVPAIACGVPVSGNTAGDGNLIDPTCSAGGSGPEELHKFFFNGPVGSQITVSMPNPGWDHILYALTSCVDPASCVGWVDSGDLVLTTTTSPQTFYIGVDGYSAGASGAYSNLLVTCPIPNGIDCGTAVPVACDSTTAGDTIGQPNNATEYAGVNGTFTGGDRIYALTLAAPTNVDVYLEGHPGRRMYLFALDVNGCNVNDVTEGGVSEVHLDAAPAGTYHFIVDGRTPADNGTYTLRIVCNDPVVPPSCALGYTVTEPAPFAWVDATTGGGTSVALTDDSNTGLLPLPFPFTYDGVAYNQWAASSNGWLSFTDGTSTSLTNASIPTATAPNTLLAPFWDDLYAGTLWYRTVGTAPNRQFVVEWSQFPDCCSGTNPLNTFEIVLFETTNVIEFQYQSVAGDRTSCTIGIESADGSSGIERYQDNVPAVPALNSYAIRFTPSPGASGPNCASPTALACNTAVNGDTAAGGLANDVAAWSCSTDGYAGNEKVYQMTLAAPQVVDLALSGFGTRELDIFVLSSCSACDCVAGGSDSLRVSLAAGTWYVVVDGFTPADNGPFTLTATCASCTDPGAHSRWTSCENPRLPITTSTTSALEWNFDDCDYCRDALNTCFTTACTFDMYIVAECGTEMHMPLYDNETGDLQIYDVTRGQYVYLHAESTGGWTAEGTNIVWQDCEGLDPNWNDQTTDVWFTGSPTLCGIYRAEFRNWGGFIWDLFSNCTGTDSPGFRIYDNYCEALAAYNPFPSLNVESMTITGSCPTYTVNYSISNAGCSAASTTVVVTSDLGGSTEKPEANILPGETRTGSITLNVQTGGSGNIFAWADFYDTVKECQEAGTGVTACSIAGGTASASQPVSCGCVIPQFSTAEVEDLSCPVGTRIFWSASTFGSGSGHYDVYRSTVSFADAVAQAPVATLVTATEWSDNGTVPGTTYWYVVRAEDAVPAIAPCTGGPHGGLYTDVNVGPIVDNLSQNANKPYDVGNDLRLDKTGAGEPRLSWPTVVPDVNTTHYHVYRSVTASAGFPASWSQIAPEPPAGGTIGSSATSWVDPSAVGTTYFYDLRSANSCEDICPQVLSADFASTGPSCDGSGSVTFTPSVQGGLAPFTYDWDFGDGSPHSSATAPTHVFAFPPHQRTVTLTVTDSTIPTPQVKVRSHAVGFGPPVSASFTTSKAGLQVTFDGIASGGTGSWLWNWRFGDNGSSTLEDPVHTYAAAGTFTVTVTATDAASGCTATATQSVTVP